MIIVFIQLNSPFKSYHHCCLSLNAPTFAFLSLTSTKLTNSCWPYAISIDLSNTKHLIRNHFRYVPFFPKKIIPKKNENEYNLLVSHCCQITCIRIRWNQYDLWNGIVQLFLLYWIRELMRFQLRAFFSVTLPRVSHADCAKRTFLAYSSLFPSTSPVNGFQVMDSIRNSLALFVNRSIFICYKRCIASSNIFVTMNRFSYKNTLPHWRRK